MFEKLVLIEAQLKSKKASSSAILLNNSHIVCTASILWQLLTEAEINELIKLPTNGFLPESLVQNIFNTFQIEVIDTNKLCKKAYIASVFISKNLKDSNFFLENWRINDPNNKYHVNKLISIFLICSFNEKDDHFSVLEILDKWHIRLKLIENIHQKDEIVLTSVPFGNRELINTYSKGIISNILGNGDLLLSDCTSAPGSEGSPVYLIRIEEKHILGILVACLTWWKGEWIGLTLIANIRILLNEILYNDSSKNSQTKTMFDSVKFSLGQIYCGLNNWGTAILLDENRRIFITNSHVIIPNHDIKIYWNGIELPASLIYKTADDEVYDIAILTTAFLPNKMKRITVAEIHNSKVGDTVYSAGYPLFGKEAQSNPSLSKGCISFMDKHVITTTCSVHAGCSGGGILTENGHLLGIIVSNVKLMDSQSIYPRVNMNIPFSAISDCINEYLKTEDKGKLRNLCTSDMKAILYWKKIDGKL